MVQRGGRRCRPVFRVHLNPAVCARRPAASNNRRRVWPALVALCALALWLGVPAPAPATGVDELYPVAVATAPQAEPAAADDSTSASNPSDCVEVSVVGAPGDAAPEAPPAPGEEWTDEAITPADVQLPAGLSETIDELAGGYAQPDTELSLEDAIRLALEHNHALNAARLKAAQACLDVEINWTNLMPQLSMQAKVYGQFTNKDMKPITIDQGAGKPPITINLAGNTNQARRQLALSLTQLIYDFGLTNDLIDVAKAQQAIQTYTVHIDEQQLVNDVIAGYYQFNLALAQTKVRADELKLAQEFQRQAEIQFEVGVAPRLDVIRAKARVEQARSSFIAAQAAVGDAAAYFYSLLGLEDQRYVPARVTGPLTELGADPPEINDAIATALNYRPELLLQYEALASGELAESLAQNRPILQAYGNALYQKPVSGFTGTDSYEYGLQLSWNLYTGGKDHLSKKKAQLALLEISEGINQLKSALELDVTTAWNRVTAARSSSDAARTNLELSGEALRAASVGYAAGVTPYIEYQNALDQNVAAAIGYLSTLAEVKLAQTNLARAMGFPYGYPGDLRSGMSGNVSVFGALGIDAPPAPPAAPAEDDAAQAAPAEQITVE